MILSSATTLGQSELGSDGNEEVLHIPYISSINVISRTLNAGVLPHCSDVVRGFCSSLPSQLGANLILIIFYNQHISKSFFKQITTVTTNKNFFTKNNPKLTWIFKNLCLEYEVK